MQPERINQQGASNSQVSEVQTRSANGELTSRATTEPQQRLRSTSWIVGLGLIMSLSPVIFGSSLKSITSIRISTIVEKYNITIGQSGALSLLIAIVPFGCVFGCVLTNKVIFKCTSRLTGVYIFTLLSLISSGLVNITTFPTLLIGRFIEGICVGFYTTLAPIYHREIAPKELRHTLGVFFSLGRVIGILTTITLELSLDSAQIDYGWRIILSLAGTLALLQAVLIWTFGSPTPTQLFERGEKQEAREVINKFYRQEYQEQVYNEYLKEDQMAKKLVANSHGQDDQQQERSNNSPDVDVADFVPTRKLQSQIELTNIDKPTELNKKETKITLSESCAQLNPTSQPAQTERQELSVKDKRCLAYSMALHLRILCGTIGGNVVLIQGGLFISTFDEGVGHYTTLVLNSIQLLSIVFGLAFINGNVGKRKIFLFSLSYLPLCCVALAVSMIAQSVGASLTFMCLYMMGYGAAFISPVWIYPSAVVTAEEMLGINCASWLSITFAMLVPPLVSGVMPGNNPFPVFFFFAVCGFIGWAHAFTTLKESDGKTYDQIIKSFE